MRKRKKVRKRKRKTEKWVLKITVNWVIPKRPLRGNEISLLKMAEQCEQRDVTRVKPIFGEEVRRKSETEREKEEWKINTPDLCK